ncbi:hypothetical protein Poli38472_004247 [Pythium oligandrum]|uniref:GYF domain-containing protein n=1 Tax=Pythium oligandrum TaxID=41045 RepID=A0A8K1FP27_PYTOL|nr:hypothetical protein Poli38472_004247 [Pythium oligandrum]|eukprot:TMW66482.1 hypothetical protein Poli38472_004247 [Pythium oligandrum]
MAEAKRPRRETKQKQRDDDRRGFTAFNMEDENEEGHFDDNGNFIWNKEDKDVQEEAWLNDLSEEQIKAASAAKGRRVYREEQEEETMTEDVANRTLATLLQSRETVLQALQRLGSKRAKSRGTKRKQGENGATPAQTAEEKEQFNRITEAADFLLRTGEVDVYSQMKEEFISEEELLAQRRAQQTEREGKSEEDTPPTQQPTTNEVMWEYKTADGQIHGPFPTSTVIAWRQQGYFVGENAVDMRQVRPASTEETKEEEPKPQLSAEEELMNDFEDSDEDEASAPATTQATADAWQRSDAIDFAAVGS